MTVLGRGASVGGLIVFGTTTSLFAKVVYELESVGLDGKVKLFQKPWAMTLTMFIGMTFCLPVAYYREHLQRKEREDKALEEPLLGDAAPSHSGIQSGSLRETLLLSIPSFFDLVATILMNIGLLSVTASVYQMMRGAEMLFAAVFAVTFLHRALNRFHLMGISCCVAGIGLVGMSSIFSGEGSSTHPVSTDQMLMGMGLIVASQAVQAAQLTFEDFFMADLAMDPMKIVGFEGVFGTLLMVFVMLPIAYFLPGGEGTGLHENTLDTLTMIKNSGSLKAVLLIDMFALLAYNISGMLVTGHLGAVFRTVLETMRTLFVWMLGLLLFYTPLGMGRLGESWTAWSPLQALGFVILVAGTLVYGRGDEEANKEELAAAIASGAIPPPAEATETPADEEAAGRVPSAAAPVPARSVPVGIRAGAAASPHPTNAILGSSLRATATITHGSYSRSLTHYGSLRGSLAGQAGLMARAARERSRDGDE
ncbi:hypothetical protein Rsub_04758 [Raphidocelis subcapitata]|uniref:EamA domain-containing protein n=1 Tax=Raphidocelis subcapitata TaxID=307507 RepID=A0A2V0NUS4_9CHLO|nr:hypothetical protein Rsub_04758 [Raphidocelis subcapitata]|eukprot:GBF91089.1 hypothetical protein Rsub_04758 [Raphidocelis subcapitata]